ncbi:unnamed protein product [Fraxinus pennsylvanica]|uniref:IST1-like protein n=1 Tax=Fraxinus pennsylvanica TaxID=56036 RepID=A0AAD2EDV6_9LAMI|nr:unnamed protein product [Fraxinus pennsylvanica]
MGWDVFDNILGLFKGKRWAKATKCKRLIKHLRSRLTLQKSRRNAIIRQSRADIAQLMQNGWHHVVSTRVEQLYRDYCRLYAYNQLEYFCECICTNLRDISQGRKLSVEVHEALSTLIFASSRCGELPELHSIRILFKQHFGHKFERANVELLPGNFVNSDIKHNLTISSVTEEVKLKLTNEIAIEFTPQLGALNQQNYLFPELQKLQGNLSTKSGKCTMTDEFKGLDADDNSSFNSRMQASISKFLLANLKNLGTFWRGFSNSADSTEGPVTFMETNKINSQKNPEGSLSVHIPNGTQVKQDTNTIPRRDYNGGHKLYSSNTWVANLSSKRYTKKNITEDISLTSHCSCRQAQNFHEDGQKNSRFDSSYVHPKLPDYDELVTNFTNLKKKCSQKNSDNRGLFDWMS